MKVARRRVDAAKRVGRGRHKYSFELSQLCLSGLPEQVSSSALVVQCARGPKVSATEEAELDEAKLAEGAVMWPSSLAFVATLYASKTGKDFSDKKYKVSLLGVKPVMGTTKKLTKELTSVDLNVSEFAKAGEVGEAVPHTLSLPLRGGKAAALSLNFRIAAKPVAKREGDDDDDDDDASISSALTGFTDGQSEMDPEALEQDLDGFGDAGTPAGKGGKESSHLRNIRELSALKEGLAASIKSKRAAAATPPTASPAASPIAAATAASGAATPGGASACTTPVPSPAAGTSAAPPPAPPPAAPTNPFSPGPDVPGALGALAGGGPVFKKTIVPPSSNPFAEDDDDEGDDDDNDDDNDDDAGGNDDDVGSQPTAAQESPSAAAAGVGVAAGVGAAASAAVAATAADAVGGAATPDELAMAREDLAMARKQLSAARAQMQELAAQKAAAIAERDALQKSGGGGGGGGGGGLFGRKAGGGGGGGGGDSDLEAQLAEARGQAAAAESRAASLATEAAEGAQELEVLRARLAAAQQQHTADEERMMEVVEAKLMAAQFAFEREEAIQKLSAMEKMAASHGGRGLKLGQQMTALEVKYEDMRLRFEKDMAGFIALKLEHAENLAKLSDLADEVQTLRGKKR